MNKSLLHELIIDFYIDIKKLLWWQVEFLNEEKNWVNSEKDDFQDVFHKGTMTVSKLNKYWENYLIDNKFATQDKYNFLIELNCLLSKTKASVGKDHQYLSKKMEEWGTEWNGSLPLIQKYFEEEFTTLEKENIDLIKTNEVDLNNCSSDNKLSLTNHVSWKTEPTNTKGYKTDLAELLYVLAKSEMIIKDHKPITHKDLTILFNELLGTDINPNKPTDLIGKRSLTETSISKLNQTLINYSYKTPKK